MTHFLTRLFLSLQTRLASEERGATTIEYALVVVAIAAIVGIAMALLQTQIEGLFESINLTGGS